MKVAVTDYTFPSLETEERIVRQAGFELISGQCKTPETLIPLVGDADVVITQFAPINSDVIRAMRNARAIVRYGIGVDNVDLSAARECGIPVCNIPEFCIDEVADHTLAFILATTRQVIPNHQHVRDGEWGLAVPLSQMRTLRDLTVGIIGFGRIGREVATRLRPFKCRRLVHDPAVAESTARDLGCEWAAIDRLLAESDIVTLHCPATSRTRRLLNRDTFAVMKPGAIVVNLGRGELIDTPALIEAIQSGRLSAAAIDVCDPEPIPADSPLRAMPNVICASHIASASVKALTTLRETAAQIAVLALRGEPLPNAVNNVDGARKR